MKKIKILVNCHKPTPRLHDGIFTPILAGAAFADDKLKKEFAAELRDDTGDNISRLQPYCAELSAVYWALKHYGELGDPDYTGL
ncbi:MAG: DUF4422 domain-containing protein, partial [Oscillospiraceae bacterium]|nr:DUF4422 domain-containing protein [Oscillospiraceae bacterium]